MAEFGEFIIRWKTLDVTRPAVLTYNEDAFDPSIWDLPKARILEGKKGLTIGQLTMHGDTILPFSSQTAKWAAVYCFHKTTVGEVFIYTATQIVDVELFEGDWYWSNAQFIVTGPAAWFREMVAKCFRQGSTSLRDEERD